MQSPEERLTVSPGCRILINEINANHEARTPEGLARNVVLIKELNSNVSKVGRLFLPVLAFAVSQDLRN